MSVNTGKHGAVESVRYLLHYAGDKLGDLRDYVEKWLKAVEGNIFYFNSNFNSIMYSEI